MPLSQNILSEKRYEINADRFERADVSTKKLMASTTCLTL